MGTVTFRKVDVDGIKVFYREAGPKDAPTILLLHGFPTAGHMFRDLIPQLADRFRLVAPDLPAFGQSDMPARGTFTYTFENIANIIDRLTEVIGLRRFAVYVFDYGAPVGFRLAMRRPERITAIISQNGNAYEEGLSAGWNLIRAYWEVPSQANREALRTLLSPETTVWQYTSTPTGFPTRLLSPRTAIRSTTSIWPAPVPMRSSWTCSATTRAMSLLTLRSSSTSGPPGRPSWRSGARTIRFSYRRVPRRSGATFPARSSASSTPATSTWKRMLTRSRRRSATSSHPESATRRRARL